MIITNEIEQKKKRREKHMLDAEEACKRADFSLAREHHLVADQLKSDCVWLENLIKKHPALDYADELLEMVKDLSKTSCNGDCDHLGETWAWCQPCKARKLIKKIEGKK